MLTTGCVSFRWWVLCRRSPQRVAQGFDSCVCKELTQSNIRRQDHKRDSPTRHKGQLRHAARNLTVRVLEPDQSRNEDDRKYNEQDQCNDEEDVGEDIDAIEAVGALVKNFCEAAGVHAPREPLRGALESIPPVGFGTGLTTKVQSPAPKHEPRSGAAVVHLARHLRSAGSPCGHWRTTRARRHWASRVPARSYGKRSIPSIWTTDEVDVVGGDVV